MANLSWIKSHRCRYTVIAYWWFDILTYRGTLVATFNGSSV